jgi:epoxyqueuosine reductase QueG
MEMIEKPGLEINSITGLLGDLVRTDPRNAVPEGDHPTIWNAPLLAIAAAGDPLWKTLKQAAVIGPIHRSPCEWLPEAKSVIVYFLPYTKAMRRTYPKRSDLPSLEWVSGRRHGEVFNNKARQAVIRLIEQHGGKAVAPSIERDYQANNMRPMWSERHAAYIAGLGTFGVHGALITEKGCSGRIGSVITDLEFPTTLRPYVDVYEYCPYPSDGRCGACIPRCPVDAIGSSERDNHRCIEYSRGIVGKAFAQWGYFSCGHCLTWLPCVDRIPFRKGNGQRREPKENIS